MGNQPSTRNKFIGTIKQVSLRLTKKGIKLPQMHTGAKYSVNVIYSEDFNMVGLQFLRKKFLLFIPKAIFLHLEYCEGFCFMVAERWSEHAHHKDWKFHGCLGEVRSRDIAQLEAWCSTVMNEIRVKRISPSEASKEVVERFAKDFLGYGKSTNKLLTDEQQSQLFNTIGSVVRGVIVGTLVVA